MPERVLVALVGLATVLPATAPAQRLVLYPDGPLHSYPVNPSRGYRDVVVGMVALANNSGQLLTVDRIEVEALAGQVSLASTQLTARDLVGATREQVGMRAAGATVIAELGFPLGVLPAGSAFTTEHPLPTGKVILLPSVYLATRGVPTRVRIRATVQGSAGASRAVELVVSVAADTTSPTYRMPLDGSWLMRAVPGVTSHHRFNPQTEFAVDFWKVDSTGSIFRGDGRAPGDYHGFGAVVRAAADGVVEAVENTATQDWDVRVRREGESANDYRRRVMRYNMETISADTRRALMGNHVIIRHANDEWSTYGHLKTGSVLVRPGDPVRAGQAVAKVGDTGDSHLAHLHFQINAGPDPLLARSLPFRFEGLVPSNPDLGIFVKPRP